MRSTPCRRLPPECTAVAAAAIGDSKTRGGRIPVIGGQAPQEADMVKIDIRDASRKSSSMRSTNTCRKLGCTPTRSDRLSDAGAALIDLTNVTSGHLCRCPFEPTRIQQVGRHKIQEARRTALIEAHGNDNPGDMVSADRLLVRVCVSMSSAGRRHRTPRWEDTGDGKWSLHRVLDVATINREDGRPDAAKIHRST